MKVKGIIIGLILTALFSVSFVGGNYCLASPEKDTGGEANIILGNTNYSINYLIREIEGGAVSYDIKVKNFPYKIQIVANDPNELRADQIIVDISRPLRGKSIRIYLDLNEETINLEAKGPCSWCGYSSYWDQCIYDRFLGFPLTAEIGNLMEEIGYPRQFYTAYYPYQLLFLKYAKIDLNSDSVVKIREMGDSIISQLNDK